MPQIAPALAGILASAATSAALVGTFSATTISIISGVVGLVVSTGLSLLLNKAPRLQRTDTAVQDRKQAVRSGIEPRNVVYGRALVSGPIVHIASSGIYKEYIHIVMPFAGHAIHAVDEVRVNGYKIAVTSFTAGGDGTAGAGVGGAPGHLLRLFTVIPSNNGAGVISPSQSSTTDFIAHDTRKDAQVRINIFDGTQEAACADLLDDLPAEWDGGMMLTGLPYIFITVRYSGEVFPQGFSSMQVAVRGKRLYDPRTGLNTYSDNAALCVLDYLMSDYGLGTPIEEIDTDAAEDAANICDELVAIDTPATTYEARFTVNGSFKLNATPADIMDALQTGWGTTTYVAGQYRIHAAAAGTPALTLTPGDFAGDLQVVRNWPRREQFNALTGTYVDPEQEWSAVAFPKVESGFYLLADGDPISRSFDLPFQISAYAAQRLARLRLLTHRAGGFQIRGTLKYSGIRLAIWSSVAVDFPDLGLVDDPFRVTAYSFDPVSGLVTVTMQSDLAAAYTWLAADAAEPILGEVTDLPTPLVLPAGATPTVTIERPVLTDGTVLSRFKVAWSADIASPFITATELQWRDTTASGEWDVLILPFPQAYTYVEPVVAGHSYQFRLRYHAALVRGAWGSTATVSAQGGEAVTPSPPTGASGAAILGGYHITFTKATAADTQATEVLEQTTPFTPVAPDYVGETTGSQYRRMVASGDYAERDVYIRTRNTAGQLSSSVLVGRFTPQAAGTVDIAPNAVNTFFSVSSTTRETPTGSGWTATAITVDVTVATGETVDFIALARIEGWDGGTASGGGAEGGAV